MTEASRQALFEKNEKIINMVIERATRDFPEDIALIGLTGSFSTGDYHEKSDLDLIIINNTDRGWQIASCFILDDVGYDIYCTPWETRIEAQSKLESPMVSCLLDLKILYCAKPEYLERFQAYQQRARDLLAAPVGKDCLDRAAALIARAKASYADAMLAQSLHEVRLACARTLQRLSEALMDLNQRYITRGAKRYREELAALPRLPTGWDSTYMTLVMSREVEESRSAALALLRGVVDLHGQMVNEFIPKPVPTFESLKGSYEELWCNCRNKVLASSDAGDPVYAFHAALSAQEHFDEMHQALGTKTAELFGLFDAANPRLFRDAFLVAMDAYLDEYRAVGRPVRLYATFEELYADFMTPDPTPDS